VPRPVFYIGTVQLERTTGETVWARVCYVIGVVKTAFKNVSDATDSRVSYRREPNASYVRVDTRTRNGHSATIRDDVRDVRIRRGGFFVLITRRGRSIVIYV